MFHLVTTLRPHRTLGRPGVKHESPAEDLADAVAQCRRQMRDNYADPFELQNEDRTTNLETAALMAEVNKEN
jgi:hypothetical protein